MAARLCAIRSVALAKRTAFRLPYVKYSTGADRTTHTAYRAIGKPDSTVARRAFLEGRAIGEWHAESKCLFCASALFRPQRSFLPYLFCQDRKDMARGAADAASQIAPRLRRIRTAPPEASRAIRRKKSSPFPGLLLRAKLSTCGCGLFTNLLFTTAQQMFHKIACGQISFSRTLACGQITIENTGQNTVFHIKFPY